jgi:hypothetical protein
MACCSFGHSKDRDDLPQLKIAGAALDPLGLPVTTVAVAGNHADDPLYIPEIQKVQHAFGRGGKTYVGDCTMAALGTRVYLASTQDYYLCPLSEKQLSREQRRELLQLVWQGRQELLPVYRPAATPAEDPELVAEGFSVDVVVRADADGTLLQGTERRWLVRSLAFAQAQQARLERRLQQAAEQLQGLNERKPGKNASPPKNCRRPQKGSSRRTGRRACWTGGCGPLPTSGRCVVTATARSRWCGSKNIGWWYPGGTRRSTRRNGRWAGRCTGRTT